MNRNSYFNFTLRDHGSAPGEKMFWNVEVGYKYKMSSMQAALSLSQLEHIGDLVDKKQQIFPSISRTCNRLKELPPKIKHPGQRTLTGW